MSNRRERRSRGAGHGGSPLPDAELEVLACLWRQGGATARQVREAMEGYRPMAHGSAVTLLLRLQAKGWVTRKKATRGKAFVYTPTRRPGPTHRRILGSLLHRIFGGNGVAMVAALFDTTTPTPQQLDELQHLLDELKAKADGSQADDGRGR